MAYVNSKDEMVTFIGSVKGNIAPKILGDNGFGWDPIFIPEGHTKTFPEMSSEEKNTVSMRKIALEKFKLWLENN